MSICELLRKQIAALWSMIERADGVLKPVVAAIAQVKHGSDAAKLQRALDFARELIQSVKSHRGAQSQQWFTEHPLART